MGAFGGVPGAVTIPPNLYQGVQSIYPGLTGTTNQAANVIRHQLAGELSPETINTIQDEAARFGVSSGLPLTNFAGYRGLKNLGRNVEDVQKTGLESYNKMLSTLGPMMTDPALAAQIAAWNATMGAAPDPRLNAEEMMRRYMQGLGTGMGARSPGGGTSWVSPSTGWFGNPAGGGGGPLMITGTGDTSPRINMINTPGLTGETNPQDFWTGGADWWQTPEATSDWLFYGGEPGGMGTDYSGLNTGSYDWWTNPEDTGDWLFYGGGGESDFGPYSGGYEGLDQSFTDLGSEWDTLGEYLGEG